LFPLPHPRGARAHLGSNTGNASYRGLAAAKTTCDGDEERDCRCLFDDLGHESEFSMRNLNWIGGRIPAPTVFTTVLLLVILASGASNAAPSDVLVRLTAHSPGASDIQCTTASSCAGGFTSADVFVEFEFNTADYDPVGGVAAANIVFHGLTVTDAGFVDFGFSSAWDLAGARANPVDYFGNLLSTVGSFGTPVQPRLERGVGNLVFVGRGGLELNALETELSGEFTAMSLLGLDMEGAVFSEESTACDNADSRTLFGESCNLQGVAHHISFGSSTGTYSGQRSNSAGQGFLGGWPMTSVTAEIRSLSACYSGTPGVASCSSAPGCGGTTCDDGDAATENDTCIEATQTCAGTVAVPSLSRPALAFLFVFLLGSALFLGLRLTQHPETQ
jgi:hypothetical protein